MTLLKEIQAEILAGNSDLAPVLLKLRFLAARLSSDFLGEWIKYETEGYPADVSVPEYRMASVAYTGTFSDGYTTLSNVQVPNHLVELHAGSDWINYPIRSSVAEIDAFIKSDIGSNDGGYGPSSANLILLLQDKVYPGHSIIGINGKFAGAPFSSIASVVRARILDLTLELEKLVPVSAEITIASVETVSAANSVHTTIITNNLVYGNQSNSNAPQAIVAFNVVKGDMHSLTEWLTGNGIGVEEARALTKLASEETPESPVKPYGDKVRAWIVEKLKKGVVEGLKTGKDILKDVIVAGLKSYYGLQ